MSSAWAPGVVSSRRSSAIERPYAERVLRRDDGGLEFRHDLEDLFNGLLEAGFSIERVHESPWARRSESTHEPGSWDHEREFVAGEFVILARRVERGA